VFVLWKEGDDIARPSTPSSSNLQLIFSSTLFYFIISIERYAVHSDNTSYQGEAIVGRAAQLFPPQKDDAAIHF